MSEERGELEPFGGEILDPTAKMNLVAQLDALEGAGVHVDSLMERIEDPDGILKDDLKHIHEGDIHHDQEGVTVFDASETEVLDVSLEPPTEINRRGIIPEKTYGANTRPLTRRKTREVGRRLVGRGRP